MDNGSLTCFGVGDGMACADRNHSACLYRLGSATLLVDCGEPLSRSYKAAGLSYDLIDRIFISHLHFDHVGGFFMLMQGFWLEQRSRELPVHLPREGIEPIRALLRAGCLFDDLLPFRLRYEALQIGEAVIQGEVRVTAFPTTHLASLKKSFGAKNPGDYAAYSFLIETPHLRVAHSADLGAPEDLAPLVEKPLDLLVCELAHFRVEDICAWLRGRAIKRIAFVHLGRPLWAKFEETSALARRLLPGVPLLFPRDGEEIVL